MFKFIHGADFHLDSPFGALPAEKAAARRRESRQLAARMGVCLKSVERGRKRSSYRRQYDNDRAYSANGKSHPRHKFKQEDRDLSFLEK